MNIAEMIQRSKQDLDAVFDAGVAKGKALGGGAALPEGVAALASGTYIWTTDPSSNFGIAHGLGTTPNFFIIFVDEESISHSDFYFYVPWQCGFAHAFTDTTSPPSAVFFKVYRYGDGTTFRQSSNQGANLSDFADDDNFYVHNTSTYQVKAGITYRWIAGVVTGI